MTKYRMIENLIENSTGRVVDGKAVLEDLEEAVGKYEGEDGTITVTGEDSQKERWDYEVDLKREYDEYGDVETKIRLREIRILNKQSQKIDTIKIPQEEKRMTREEFYENTKTYILGLLPGKYSGYEVEIRDCRNQGGPYKGMILKPSENKPSHSILPVFNLDNLYDRYGRLEIMDSLIAIAEDVESVFLSNEMSDMPTEKFLDNILSYEKVKEKLYVSVMSEGRQKNIEDALYVMKEDIPLHVRIQIKEDGFYDDMNASIEVNEQLINKWNVSFEQVLEDAFSNTGRIHPVDILSMTDALKEMMGEDVLGEEIINIKEPEMYIITNREKNYGAASLFLPGVMEKISEKLKDSYFVLPSSVHEMIIIPAYDIHGGIITIEDIKELKNTVSDINKTQVALGERLSDNVYFFDANSKTFLKAEDAIDLNTDHRLVSERNKKETGDMKPEIPYPMI